MSRRPVRRRPVRRRALAVLAAVGLALAGCAAMPDSGPVTAANIVPPDDVRVTLIADGPSRDATANQIVQGFLRAVAAGGGDDFAVAREYLAGPVAQTWNPRAQVRIYSARDEPIYSETPEGAVRVAVPASASLDAEGRYTEAAADSVMQLDFSLARGLDGQWRIVALDDGILLAPVAFDAQYSDQQLYFLTADREMLVPETRWFPDRSAATQIVRQLLEGPSPWLAGGVTTAAPTGTQLVGDSVLLADGVATVELSPEVLSMDPATRTLFRAQLEESLRTLRMAHTVRITVGGNPLPQDEDVPGPLRPLYVTGNPVVVADDELLRFNGTELLPLPDGVALEGFDPRSPALPYDETPGSIVLLDGTDRLITRPTTQQEAVLLDTGTDLVAPSIDRLGWVWTTPRRSDGTVRALQPNGTAVDVTASWLTDASVLSMRISRDGARAVVVSETDGVSRADVTAVVRDAGGAPVALGEPVGVGDMLLSASVVTWVDETTVAILGTSGTDPVPSVHLVAIGGPSTDLPAVEGAQTITAATGDRSLVLGTEDGQLFARNGLGWTPTLVGARDPAFPG